MPKSLSVSFKAKGVSVTAVRSDRETLGNILFFLPWKIQNSVVVFLNGTEIASPTYTMQF